MSATSMWAKTSAAAFTSHPCAALAAVTRSAKIPSAGSRPSRAQAGHLGAVRCSRGAVPCRYDELASRIIRTVSGEALYDAALGPVGEAVQKRLPHRT